MAHRHKHHAKHKAHGGHVEDTVEKEHEEMAEAHGKRKHGGRVHGGKKHHRLDKRARGGGVGSDKHPFSSAAHHHKHGGHVGK